MGGDEGWEVQRSGAGTGQAGNRLRVDAAGETVEIGQTRERVWMVLLLYYDYERVMLLPQYER